jgi:hypothetical protein
LIISRNANLEETNVIGVLLEASTANVHAVLSDQTVRVGADAAKLTKKGFDKNNFID